MLRIHFTGDDIARTRIAPAPDPLWELVMSLHMLRPQPGDLLFRRWRRRAGGAIRDAANSDPAFGERVRLLLALTPPIGYFPDFLNPTAALDGLEHGLEAVRSTPRAIVERDLRHLAGGRRLPDGVRRLADGDAGSLTELADTMRTCHRLAVIPYRSAVDAAVERDRRVRIEALAGGGVEALLASLAPTMRWTSGELSIPRHRDQELHLDGRGLLLIPSYFCLTGPVTLFDPALPPVVVYPVAKELDTPAGADRSTPSAPGALGTLIGSRRAAVLEAMAGRPMTTTEVARRVGIGVSTASEHATVLRQAGLVTSRRHRNRVLHRPTPLGRALLAAEPTVTDDR